VGLAEAVIGGRTASVATNTTQGSSTITVPNTAQVAIGEQVTGVGIAQVVTANNVTTGANTYIVAIGVNPDNSLQLTLSCGGCASSPETAFGATTVTFDSTPCFGAFQGSANSPGAGVQRVIQTTASSSFSVGGQPLPGVTYNGVLGSGVPAAIVAAAQAINPNAPICESFVADSTLGLNSNPIGVVTTAAAANPQAAPFTITVSVADAARLAVGDVAIGPTGNATITAINAGTGVITLTARAVADGTAAGATVLFTPGPIPSLNGVQIDNGIPVTFLATNIVSGNINFINAGNSTITLSSNASNPLPGQPVGANPAVPVTSNIPINFNNGAGSGATIACPIIPFSQRGGASTDPNDGSLWLYGEFAKNRLSTIPGPGQWGTSVANYALSFPATDPYGNDNTYFQDVQPANAPVNGSIYFTWVQLAKNLGLAVPAATGPCSINNGVNPIQQPPGSGQQPVGGPTQLNCPYFRPDFTVTRAEMAYWVVKAQMDEFQVSAYLCATGGDPTGLTTTCAGGIPAYSFADFANVTNPFLGAIPSLNIAGVTTDQLRRYIEVMIRRGYTKGCGSTNDPQFAYCPNDPVTREQMAVFLIRAKMNNVFPTTLSGTPLASPFGDNFGVFSTTFFTDLAASDAPYAPFINKMRELRISNGTGPTSFSPTGTLTRKEIATFIVRAFFL